MKQHIASFPRYLQEGYDIGQEVKLDISLKQFSHIIFVGMGGSGMTSTILQTIIEQGPHALPCKVIKDYAIPTRVNEQTLMIVASYSGNTEETIAAMQKGLEAGAHMVAVTSGGKLKEFAKSHQHTLAEMPTGIEPRAALPYAFGIQLALFERLGALDESVSNALSWLQTWTLDEHQMIHEEAKHIAESIADAIPVIYSTTAFAPLTLRARQQLNENSRMLCWDHLIPEQNHNELLGWQEGNKHVQIIRLEDVDMYSRNSKRIELTKKILTERKIPMQSIVMQGKTYLQKTVSTIYRIDWLSYYTAMRRGVDPSGMELIEWFKGELNNFI